MPGIKTKSASARIRIHDAQELTPAPARNWVTPEVASQISQRELEASIILHEQGGEDTLRLFEVSLLPDTVVDVHAHVEEEVIYVLEGELFVGGGQRSLQPGSSIYVAGSTLYSFRAGPEGLRFLNFRPRSDNSYIAKNTFKARQQ